MNINLTTPANEIDEVISVVAFIPESAGVALSAGPVLDITVPGLDEISASLVTGAVVWISDATYTGVWVLGSTAVPSAVPLTRHPSYPSTYEIKVGTIVRARYAPRRHSGVGTYMGNTYSFPVGVFDLDVNTTANTVGSYFGLYGPCWFKFTSLNSGAALPGGLSLGTWYYLGDPTTKVLGGSNSIAPVYAADKVTPIDLTTVGTDGAGSSIGTVVLCPVFASLARLIHLRTDAALSTSLASATVALEGDFFKDYDSTSNSFLTGGYAAGGNATAESGATALGANSIAMDNGIALGNTAVATPNSFAVGSNQSAQENAIAILASASAKRSVALGRSAESVSEVAFMGLQGAPTGSGYGFLQAYFDWASWGSPSFPAKMSVSQASFDLGQTNLTLVNAGSIYFEGTCVVNIKAVSASQFVGTNVIRLVGVIYPIETSPYFAVAYRADEVLASFSGSVSVTLTADFYDFASKLEVTLDFDLDTGTYFPTAYLNLQTFTIGTANGVEDAGLKPAEVGAGPSLQFSLGLNF